MKHGIVREGKAFVAYFNGDRVGRAYDQRGAERHFEKANGTFVPRRGRAASTVASVVPFVAPTAPRFHINKRFEFLSKTVKMVAKGLQASAVISGSGGLGKSYTVKKALVEAGLTDMTVIRAEEGTRVNRAKSFVIVKGYSTARGLYETLWENNDSVIVFDDTDAILKDPIALNLLKAALDSYDTRVISWNAILRDEDLPRSFIFTGRIVFITNLSEAKIDQAIRSRSAVIDLSMSTQETFDRMSVLAKQEDFLPEYDTKTKAAALAFIGKMKSSMKELNLRTLITVTRVAATGDSDWEELAEYVTCK
jgi:hypothetical protein